MGILENRNFPERTILAATLTCVFDGDSVGKSVYRPPQEAGVRVRRPEGTQVRRFPSSFANFPMPWFTGKARVHPSYPSMSLAGTPRTGIEFSFDSSTPRA
jgi:hypothetical protein